MNQEAYGQVRKSRRKALCNIDDFCVSRSSGRRAALERTASEELVARIDSSSWIEETFAVSPDGKRYAYVAQAVDKQLVIVDGNEGKRYNVIGQDTLVFSLTPMPTGERPRKRA